MPVFGEDLQPQLAPLAATYRKERDAIGQRQKQELEKPLAEYLEQLKSAEQRATKAGDVTALSAVTKEIANVEKGIFLPIADVQLPKLVQSQHKSFHRTIDDLDTRSVKTQQALNSKYLAALAKITPTNGENRELARQIAEEKRVVITGISGPITNLQTQIGGTRWQSIPWPDHFEYFGPDGSFSHWKYTTPDPQTVVLHWNDKSNVTWKLGKDGKTLIKNGVPDLRLVTQKPGK